MSTSDRRARDKDRDAAIEIVEAAWADGQIIDADRDRRVEELLRAQTLAEIRMLTHDLQVPDPSSPVAAVAAVAQVAPVAPVHANPYASRSGYATLEQVKAARPRSGAGCGLVVLMLVIAIFGVAVAAVVGIASTIDDGFDTVLDTDTSVRSTPLPGERPDEGVNVLSERGYRDLLDDVEATTGSTEAFEAVLYPGYAVVYLPVDPNSQRHALWYWNGVMDDLDSRGTSSYTRFDLAEVDMLVVVRLVKRVRGLVEDPTLFYAIVRAPDPETGEAISVYASNEYVESAFLLATLDGRVVYNSTQQ